MRPGPARGLRRERRETCAQAAAPRGWGWVWVGRDCPTRGSAGRRDRVPRGPRHARGQPESRALAGSVSQDGSVGGEAGNGVKARPAWAAEPGVHPEARDSRGACVYSLFCHSTSVLCANPSPAAPLGAGHTARGGSCSPEAPRRHPLQGRWRLWPGPGGGGERAGVTGQLSHQ